MYNLFCEIVKFRDFKRAFLNFAKSFIAHIFAIFKYFGDYECIIRFAKYSNFAILRELLNFTKSIIAHIFPIFNQYFAKQTIYSDSPDHVLLNDTHV